MYRPAVSVPDEVGAALVNESNGEADVTADCPIDADRIFVGARRARLAIEQQVDLWIHDARGQHTVTCRSFVTSGPHSARGAALLDPDLLKPLGGGNRPAMASRGKPRATPPGEDDRALAPVRSL